jgi:uncharacterized membrane protein
MEKHRSTSDIRPWQNRGRSESTRERNWAELTIGVAVTAAGLYLATQGMRTGRNHKTASMPRRSAHARKQGIEVQESITINRPTSELYRQWRNLENLPNVMRHLEKVTDLGGGRSHWIAKGPAGAEIEWYAEIVEDVENSRLVWRSVGDASVPNEGSVTFNKDPLCRGSEVHVTLTYHPPMGPLGATVARLFGEEPGRQIREDLKRYKQFLESEGAPGLHGFPARM